MERKIGEIFEFKKDWYQCVEGRCKDCHFSEKRYLCKQFIVKNFCLSGIIFKKLEKIGEPCEFQKRAIQTYKLYTEPFISVDMDFINTYLNGSNTIDIIITQDIEDMGKDKTPLPKEDNSLTRVVYAYVNGKISDNELIKSIKEMSDKYPFEKNNLKPFSLEEAKQGKPVCTRDGRKARIICFDAKRKDKKSIIALVPSRDYPGFEDLIAYYNNGNYHGGHENDGDLMMPPEKKEGWVNMYRDCDGVNITKDDNIYSLKDAAIASAQMIDRDNYVATIKIQWEE